VVISSGFTMIDDGHCVYTERFKGNFVIISLYVANILIAGNDMELINKVKTWISSNFEIKDMRKAA